MFAHRDDANVNGDGSRLQRFVGKLIGVMTAYDLDSAARVVQLALTPVFLLSGTATLLNVFSTRLGRVSDRVDSLTQETKETGRTEMLTLLRRRSHVLIVAVVMSALAGGFTCAAVLVLFLGELRGTAAARLLFLSFGGAIALTMAALAAFVVEMLLAAKGVRRTVDRHVGSSSDEAKECEHR